MTSMTWGPYPNAAESTGPTEPTYPELPCPPALAPAVVAQMRCDVIEDPRVEYGWVGRADESGQIVAVQLVARGNNALCPLSARDAIAAGMSYIIHSHPLYVQQPRPYPSERDILSAMECASVGVGFVIVNGDVSDAFVVRLPRPTPAPSGPKPRVWSVGPFTLIHHRSNRHES